MWLTHAGRFKVEHVPCPGPTGAIDAHLPPLGLLHTTQGPTIEGALSVFRQHFRPKFTAGRDAKRRVRILQHSPLGVMDAALKHTSWPPTNGRVRAQIEIVGFSQFGHPWLPDPAVEEALCSLLVELEHVAGIPLRHPPVRRDAKLWMHATGWVGHIDAPENDHVDPGTFDYARTFRRCRELELEPSRRPPKAKPRGPRPGTVALNHRAKKTPASPLCGAAGK